MVSLPPPSQLIQRCRALAAVDLILSPEWQYRYYSFNSQWAPGELMASMRDGCGDEWWIVFSERGWTALKGLGHEGQAWRKSGPALSTALQKAIPASMSVFAHEPAFRWEATTFAYTHDSAAGWTRINDLTAFAAATDTGEKELLKHLLCTPAEYAAFAEEYFEVEVEEAAVAAIFAHQPITQDLVSRLCPETALELIARELHDEIGYPKV